ncbi:hypothetical protein ASG01_09230 [Chryseobacterium sp. Leaf180]|uniref:glycosyltransferase n=1 Tax=Chryseobacterium sp. Leaf180 TaxID=1736289 RepID=UPI0006F7978F|nr:glycosyltransferase [Chryseobacterium sp. Leaf180]KQR93363.1 hypothetical protein ASG01_09230 [Chryseobacterium sp. Leaf180]
MKILLVSGFNISLKEPFNSGVEAFMVSFAHRLFAEGHEVDIFAEEADDTAAFKIIKPSKNHYSDSRRLAKRAIEKHQYRNLDVDSYDLIHYHMFYPHLIKAGMNFKKKSFLTLHTPPEEERIAFYKERLKTSDLNFIAVSKRIKKQWEEVLEIDIPLINNGIDVNLWPIKKTSSGEYLLWSARIAEEKNVADAIRLAQHLDLPLKIAGRIVNQQYFDENVKPYLNSKIKYIGHVTQREISGLAQNAKVYLATATWQEPFGLAALEMLASGVPVVGFNTAVPPSWKHISVLTTESTRWEDLIGLVEKSTKISPFQCREFALGMTIQKMTSDYLELFNDKLFEQTDFSAAKIAESTQILS